MVKACSTLWVDSHVGKVTIPMPHSTRFPAPYPGPSGCLFFRPKPWRTKIDEGDGNEQKQGNSHINESPVSTSGERE